MNVWTIANQKGGVGKTTTTATLGGLLAEQGHRVLLIDCDPHGSLTSYFGFDSDELDMTLYDLFEIDAKERSQIPDHLFLSTRANNLFLLPSSISMATLDKKFSDRKGMGLIIKHLAELIDDEFDFLLLDCPPILGVLLVNAIAACDQLIIPVQTEFLALKGLDRMMQTVNAITKTQKHSFCYTITPTLFDRRTRASVKTLRQMRDRYGPHLWPKVIPIDTKFRDASQEHLPLNLAYPEARGVEAYRKLLQHILNQSKPKQSEGAPS